MKKMIFGLFAVSLLFIGCDNVSTSSPHSVSISGGDTVMIDTDLSFTATASNLGGATVAYQWKVDGADESGATGTSYTFNQSSAGSYAVTCVTTVDSVEYTSNTVTVAVTAYSGSIGDTGPGGGVVFYDDTIGYDFDGDGTIDTDEKALMTGTGYRFLEAAPSGWDGSSSDDPQAKWADPAADILTLDNVADAGSNVDVLTGTVGNGASNTDKIVEYLSGISETGRAAQLASDYAGGGKSDWFLPSAGELKILWSKKDTVGGFSSAPLSFYWSSSENTDGTDVWDVDMGSSDGDVSGSNKTWDDLYVRPIRAFN